MEETTEGGQSIEERGLRPWSQTVVVALVIVCSSGDDSVPTKIDWLSLVGQNSSGGGAVHAKNNMGRSPGGVGVDLGLPPSDDILRAVGNGQDGGAANAAAPFAPAFVDLLQKTISITQAIVQHVDCVKNNQAQSQQLQQQQRLPQRHIKRPSSFRAVSSWGPW